VNRLTIANSHFIGRRKRIVNCAIIFPPPVIE